MSSESLAPFVRRVVVAEPGDTVASAARKLRDGRVGCVVVARAGHAIGILTDRDIALRAVAGGLDPELATVQTVMTADPFLLEASDSLESAVHLMQKHGIRRLPIVDDQRMLLGIVTADDIVAHLGDQMASVGGALAEPADSDDSR